MLFFRFKKISIVVFFYILSNININTVNATTAYVPFSVRINVPSSCAISINKPNLIENDNFLVKVTSNIILVCNSETEASIKIINNNFRQQQNQIVVLDFKRNNKLNSGFKYESYVQLFTINANVQTDMNNDVFSYKKNELENSNKDSEPEILYTQKINDNFINQPNIEDLNITFEIRY
jgi:hypothetical protein